MARYWIVKVPCAYVSNGEAIYHKRIPQEPVEIDDTVASFLGDQVRRVDPFAEPFMESVAAALRRKPPKQKRKVEEEKPHGDTQLRKGIGTGDPRQTDDGRRTSS